MNELNLRDFRHGGVNITGFNLINAATSSTHPDSPVTVRLIVSIIGAARMWWRLVDKGRVGTSERKSPTASRGEAPVRVLRLRSWTIASNLRGWKSPHWHATPFLNARNHAKMLTARYVTFVVWGLYAVYHSPPPVGKFWTHQICAARISCASLRRCPPWRSMLVRQMFIRDRHGNIMCALHDKVTELSVHVCPITNGPLDVFAYVCLWVVLMIMTSHLIYFSWNYLGQIISKR